MWPSLYHLNPPTGYYWNLHWHLFDLAPSGNVRKTWYMLFKESIVWSSFTHEAIKGGGEAGHFLDCKSQEKVPLSDSVLPKVD